MLKNLCWLLLIAAINYAQSNISDVNKLIAEGEYTKAETIIKELLKNSGADESIEMDLQFKIEKMNRIRKDFQKTSPDVLKYVQRYYPDASESDLLKWEKDGTLEYKVIDGRKLYFNRAPANLFRVNMEAKTQKIRIEGKRKDGLDQFLESYLPGIVEEAERTGEKLVDPVDMKIKYRLIVDADAVPDGEIIRVWLPFPRESHARQHSIKLTSTNVTEYVVADNKNLQRTIYMEKAAERGETTEFTFELEFTGVNQWQPLDPENIAPYDIESDSYIKFTSERKPHIVFSEKVKELSARIVGDETNPIIIARKIYKWLNDNIPWAGAREYSTIDNISDYCLSNGWGDCGIQTLTFMTLCRFNGIPAKWQSGWMLHPGEVNLHDWCEIYFEGIGWIPVDQSFKLVESDDEDVRWFFFGGIDAFHFIVNDDYSQPLFPAKIYPRSETVDFQRGEVEWRGGNLYFDKWDYFMRVEYLNKDF